jgi:hypothetical protein
MTEAEWLECSDPYPMLESLRGKASDRKLRLWGCACCEQIRHLYPHSSYSLAVATAERFADGLAAPEELRRHRERVVVEYEGRFSSTPRSVAAIQGKVLEAVCAVASSERSHLEYALWFNVALALEGRRLEEVHRENASSLLEEWLEATSEYAHDFKYFLRWADIDPRPYLISLLYDIIGNPFRPSPPLPHTVLAWNDGTVRRISEGIYEERAFDRLPILADALLDAGCDNDDLLAHCRSDGPHVRGCWALDLILGKE